uniref:Uncharacterized protein n=1 Tax=Leersia perrieri TaxID=77586 RepID=A0A0D9VJY6_9ORYZ
MEAVWNTSGQLHLRDNLQVRRPRVHHHEPVLAGALVVDVAHHVAVVLVAVPLDVVGHEERFTGEAPGPKVAARHGAVACAGEVEVELGHAADLGHGVADAEVSVPVAAAEAGRVDDAEVEVTGGERGPRDGAGAEVDANLLDAGVDELHPLQRVLDGEDVWRHKHDLLAAGLLPRVHRVHHVEPGHLEPPHLRLVGGVARDHAETWHLVGVGSHGRAAADHHVHGFHHDLNLREDGVPLGDCEVVQERRLLHGEERHVRALVPGRVEPKVCDERRHGPVAEREELAGDGVFLGVRGHAHDESAAEVTPADRGDLAGVRVDAHGVGEVGLAERVEAGAEVGEAGVGEPGALQQVHLPRQDPRRRDGAARHPGHAVESREHVGHHGRARVALYEVLVRLHVARAQDGVIVFASGREEEGVEHAVAVEQVVRPTREVLRVGPVSDVRAAGEASRDGAAHDGARRRRQLVHWREVARQHVARVHRRPQRRRVDERVDHPLQRVAERHRQRGGRRRRRRPAARRPRLSLPRRHPPICRRDSDRSCSLDLGHQWLVFSLVLLWSGSRGGDGCRRRGENSGGGCSRRRRGGGVLLPAVAGVLRGSRGRRRDVRKPRGPHGE